MPIESDNISFLNEFDPENNIVVYTWKRDHIVDDKEFLHATESILTCF